MLCVGFACGRGCLTTHCWPTLRFVLLQQGSPEHLWWKSVPFIWNASMVSLSFIIRQNALFSLPTILSCKTTPSSWHIEVEKKPKFVTFSNAFSGMKTMVHSFKFYWILNDLFYLMAMVTIQSKSALVQMMHCADQTTVDILMEIY